MTDTNNRLFEMNLIQEEFEQKFLAYNLPIGRISQNGISINGLPVTTTIWGPIQNRQLLNTNYFYSTGKTLLHFTSLKYLFSIINEKSFRLYNLLNSNDPNEYGYSIGKLQSFYKKQGKIEDWIASQIQYVKETEFILSCTSIQELTSSKFWDEYGDGGKGVCIELEVIDNPINWEGFYLSKIKYGELNRWNEFISEILTLCDKHPSNYYDFRFDMIFCLHKSPDPTYIREKEIRILGQKPQKHGWIFDSFIHTDIGEKNIPVQYLKLPIWTEQSHKLNFQNEKQWLEREHPGFEFSVDDFSSFLNQSPTLKITKVFVGQNFHPADDDFNTFQKVFRNFTYDNLGYEIDICSLDSE